MSKYGMRNRKALIIHCGGNGQEAILEAIRAFLLSNHGGAWEGYEITVAPEDCSEAWLDEYFWNCRSAAYFLLFHIGRRHHDERKGIMYHLPNGEEVSWTWLRIKTQDAPTLLIADDSPCTTIGNWDYDDAPGMTDKKKRSLCREMYDDAISLLPYGMFVTASAYHPGEDGAKKPHGDGCYIASLIEAAEKIRTYNHRPPGMVYSIAMAHTMAARTIKEQTDGVQMPTLERIEKKRQPPFLVKIRKRKNKTKRTSPIR